MTVSGQTLRDISLRYRGQPYSTAPARTDPNSPIADCSGLIVKTLVPAGIHPGGTVSTTLEVWAVNNGGRYISAEEAQRTPMCCAAIWGIGSNGHIGFSWGDGRTYETPSDEGRRVGYSRFWRNRWTRFFTLPGVDHHGAGGAPAQAPKGQEMILIKNSEQTDPNKTWFLFSDEGCDQVSPLFVWNSAGRIPITECGGGEIFALAVAQSQRRDALAAAIAKAIPAGGGTGGGPVTVNFDYTRFGDEVFKAINKAEDQ